MKIIILIIIILIIIILISLTYYLKGTCNNLEKIKKRNF